MKFISYYQTENDYLKNRNLFYSLYVLKIQRMYRLYVYRKNIFIEKKNISCLLIQKKWHAYQFIKKKLNEMNKKIFFVVKIQKIFRGKQLF